MRWGDGDALRGTPAVPARAGTTMGGVVGCVGARGSGQGGGPPALAGGRFANRPYDRGGAHEGGGDARAAGGGRPPSSALRTGFDRLRANGFGRRACGGEWGMRWGTETPRAAPLWIPAFAGMTRVGVCGGCWWWRAPFDRLRANGFGKRACGGEWGMRSGTETPRAAPLWIPAFAGMTRVGDAGRTRGGVRRGGGPFDRVRANGFGKRPCRGEGGGGDAMGDGGAPRRAPALGSPFRGNDGWRGRCGATSGGGILRLGRMWSPGLGRRPTRSPRWRRRGRGRCRR